MAVQPHVSAAVKHLRGWITLLSVVIAVCAITQMLVYGFVNYTDVRFDVVQRTTPFGERKLEVLAPNEPVAAQKEEREVAVAGGVRAQAIERGKEVAPVRVKSSADRVMARISDTTTSLGSFACVCLAGMTLLGVVIAGGGGIPGVEKAVTAGFWALVLGLLSLPWSSAFPGLKIPGVFAAYHLMTATADGVAGSIGLTAAFGQWIVMPIVASLMSILVCIWYRAGVERGVVATSVNHFDRAIEQEMSTIAKRGITRAGPRTLGVMNRPIGASEPSQPAVPTAPIATVLAARLEAERPMMNVEQAVDEAAALAASLARETSSAANTSNGRGVADANFRRLI